MRTKLCRGKTMWLTALLALCFALAGVFGAFVHGEKAQKASAADSGNTWQDGTSTPKIITWTLGRADQPSGLEVAGGDNVKYGDAPTLSVTGAQEEPKDETKDA